MHHRFRILTISGAAMLLPALFVAGPASSAAHDGPGPNCVTHVGQTYVSGGRVYSEGSGGCNASANRSLRHDLRHDIEQSRWWGWEGIGTHSQNGLKAPFSVWLPLDRAANCPRTYRGHISHWSQDYGYKERYTNTTSC